MLGLDRCFHFCERRVEAIDAIAFYKSMPIILVHGANQGRLSQSVDICALSVLMTELGTKPILSCASTPVL